MPTPSLSIGLLAVCGFAPVALAAPQGSFQNHVDQDALAALVAGGQRDVAYTTAFDGGDELFHFFFTLSDGAGANVGNGERFTRVPRADLTGPGQWAQHIPSRSTGPNEQSCTACHIQPLDDGAGSINSNVHRDPQHSGNLSHFIQRNTPHVFGSGAVQKLAEEITTELQAIRAQAEQQACATGTTTVLPLQSHGVNYGNIRVIPHSGPGGCVPDVDNSQIRGVSNDLIIRPFGWKGTDRTVREFCRGASHNEIGMQPVELVGPGVDGDFDGVVDEMTIGDQTGMAIYVSGQPRPLSTVELDAFGFIDPPLTPGDIQQINDGKRVLKALGCAACHVPQMRLNDFVFREPSLDANYRDATLPSGQDPVSVNLNPASPVSYDLTADLPDNQIFDSGGNLIAALGNFQVDGQGRAIVELFGDLKRHDMGPGLAEQIDEIGTGASVWLTENLWGCGATAPYLHDGRATTLDEAILMHGGEAQAARDAYVAAAQSRKDALIAFLKSLVITKLD